MTCRLKVFSHNLLSYKTVRSVELSFLQFTDPMNDWCELLEKIRDTLGWCERSVAERPSLIVHDVSDVMLPVRYSCLDKAVNNFIYSDGQNPYERIPQGLASYQLAKEYPDLGIQRYPFRYGPNGSDEKF